MEINMIEDLLRFPIQGMNIEAMGNMEYSE